MDKCEFKWILSIDIRAEDFKSAKRAYALAQDAFFDSLMSDDVEFEVIDEENK